MNGDRAGFLPRMPARSRGRCIPIHLRVACVCSFCASVWCYVRKKMWRTHSCIDSGVIATGKTTDPLWTCVFMRGRERFFFFVFFLAGLLTIQPLSNPALPLSTYNMAAYPLAGLQTGREESADAEERPIRGRVIENTQRESTDSESRATRGRCSVCARECVCVCRERKPWWTKVCIAKETNSLCVTSDEILSLFLLPKTSIEYRGPECKRDTVQETCLINSLAATTTTTKNIHS